MDASDCGALQNYLGGDTESLLQCYYYSSDIGRRGIADAVRTLAWPAFNTIISGSD